MWIFSLQVFAQDPLFTHTNYGLSMINPAFAGSMTCTRAEIGYRVQPLASDQYMRTTNVTYDLYSMKAGIMLNYLRDDLLGMITRNRFDINCTYGYGIGTDAEGKSLVVIQPGIQVSYFKTNVPVQSGQPEIFDPRYGIRYELHNGYSRRGFDLSAGLLINSKYACVGFSVYHLTQENAAWWAQEVSMRFTFHGAFILGNKDAASPKLSIIPSFVYMRQYGNDYFNGLLMAKYHGARLGIGFRYGNKEAAVLLCGYTFRKATISYSYDMLYDNPGKIGGAHEIHFSYLLFTRKWSLGLLNTQAFF